MSQKPEMCKLQIQKARRSDAGEYELHLENASGKVDVPITIKVIGRPLVHSVIVLIEGRTNALPPDKCFPDRVPPRTIAPTPDKRPLFNWLFHVFT